MFRLTRYQLNQKTLFRSFKMEKRMINPGDCQDIFYFMPGLKLIAKKEYDLARRRQ